MAQPAIFLQGDHLETTISQGGYYYTPLPPPSNFHPTSSVGFGLVSDVLRTDWASTGSIPDYCGDYFSPGTAIEGFAVEVNGGAFEANTSSSASGDMIPGLLTATENGPGSYRFAVWEGQAAAGALDIRQTTFYFRDRQYVYTVVDLCNASAAALNEVFYSRNWDPDNEHAWGGSFSTSHEIISQPPADSHAAIRTEGSLFGCYMETISSDSRAKVSYGGFFQGSPSASWNGTFPYLTAGSRAADESNQISFNVGTLEAGDCTCLSFVSVYMEMERPNAVARLPLACGVIDSLLANPYNSSIASMLDPFSPVVQDRTSTGSANSMVYPNPSKGWINFSSNLEGTAEASLYNHAGSLLLQTNVSAASWMDLSDYPSGIYFLQIQSGTGMEVIKVVLE